MYHRLAKSEIGNNSDPSVYTRMRRYCRSLARIELEFHVLLVKCVQIIRKGWREYRSSDIGPSDRKDFSIFLYIQKVYNKYITSEEIIGKKSSQRPGMKVTICEVRARDKTLPLRCQTADESTIHKPRPDLSNSQTHFPWHANRNNYNNKFSPEPGAHRDHVITRTVKSRALAKEHGVRRRRLPI